MRTVRVGKFRIQQLARVENAYNFYGFLARFDVICNLSDLLWAGGRINCGCAYAHYVRDGGRYSSEFFWGSRDTWLQFAPIIYIILFVFCRAMDR